MELKHQTYTKINTLYKRHVDGPNKGKIILGEYSDKEVEYLKNCQWQWFEKLDGTNFAVYWDGHKKEFHGKSENAQIKKEWIDYLETIFTDETLSAAFPLRFDENGNEISMLVRVYGELHGKGIQGKMGKAYSDDAQQDFIFRVFDINIGEWWLEMDAVSVCTDILGVEMCPYIGEMTVDEAEAIVKKGFKSRVGDCEAEGLVGRPLYGLRKRNGGRILVKIKTCDYRQLGITE